ncbi:DUF4114 domain-containing protein [Corallococcus sp. bb12-1]|uniref:DUF4114 domain-containing protein n=1 Tax=Corallococcus sp. bb12-1 TaxID=2996784 RepID=UPI0022718D07|nr:DUF4114 domain-containing protein [Corallococcus sp. bb12-1]MCY1044637.1 DUF4114 domain-containing protein [Corallococcus sp. bb12-1]
MHPPSSRRLALVAGAALSVMPTVAVATESPSLQGPKAVRLPPQLTSVTQSVEALYAGDPAQLGVQAVDPQGSPLTFSWSASAGTLGAPVNGANSSSRSWTAPACLADGSAPVVATVSNGLGLSTSAAFEFSVVQDLYLDRQPAFAASGFTEIQGVTLTSQQTLRANPAWMPESPEYLVLPSDQRLTVSFVYESAGGSHALGYLYVDDLVATGFVDSQGNLRDSNANGIADLHEDLYNLAPPTGPQARAYIGVNRRCTRTFTSGGFTYSQPELASNSSCATAFSANQSLEDARPGSHPNVNIDVVGSLPPATPGTGHSDNGLFARIPNLLEPTHALNGNRGLGHLPFLLSDDDSDLSTYQQLGAVGDGSTASDGIPDYDVSAYDAHGLPRSVNPNPGISSYDRTVDLGVVQGGRELVFFLVVASAPSHVPDEGTVFPCLRKDPNGQCTLHLKSPISVFFSKAKWNLDQDPVGQAPAAARNLGCSYSELCNPAAPSTGACTVVGTTQSLCGWLDSDARVRLNTPNYGNINLPRTATVAPQSLSINMNMPHVMVGATDNWPGEVLMAFEDLNGGGDRDFNDVVFLLRSDPYGAVRSRVLSPADAGCAISHVYFEKQDTRDAATCDATSSIAYAVSTDCGSPTPTWHPVTFQGPQQYRILDVSSTPGHQLCWKATLAGGRSSTCQPTISNVDIGYESVPVTP